MLGLDGEMLADQFRRRYEEPAAAASPAAEPVLQNRRARRAARPPSRGPLIAAIAIAIVALLVVLGLLGRATTSGDDGDPARPAQDAARGKGDGGQAREKDEASGLEPVDITRRAAGPASRSAWSADPDDALIDSPGPRRGATEQFGGEKRYRLDLASGGDRAARGRGREPEQLEAATEAASFEADSEGISEIDYAGPDCP